MVRRRNPPWTQVEVSRERLWNQAALMLVAARLRPIAATKWGTKRYLVPQESPRVYRWAEVHEPFIVPGGGSHVPTERLNPLPEHW